VSDFLASQVPGSLLLIIGSGVAGWGVLQKISKNGDIAVDIAGLLAIA
jgi:saccharopine dehydrogenase-like NADP-dependent oxidoreductase